MSTVTETTLDTGPDLDAIQASAEGRVAELRERRQGLSLDALDNKKAATALAKLESELADAEGQLARVGLARTEQERRDARGRQQAEADARQVALERARELQGERELQARRIDEAATAFAEAIAVYVPLCAEQERQLRRAGHSAAGAARFRSSSFESALRRALRDAGVRRGTIALSPSAGPGQRLAENTARPVEPRAEHQEAVRPTRRSTR